MKRYKLSNKSSRKMFSRTGSRTHVRNLTNPMRGGIRL